MKAILEALGVRTIVNVIRVLNGGTVGFNYCKFTKDELVEFVCGSDAKGKRNFTDDEIKTAIETAGKMNRATLRVVKTPAAEQPVEEQPPVEEEPEPLPVAAAVAAVVTDQNVVALPKPVIATPTDYSSIRVVRAEKASKVFGVKLPKAHDVDVEIWNDPDAPAVDPLWVWDERLLHRALTAMAHKPRSSNLWLTGEKGTGKTQFVGQLGARLGRSVHVIQFDRYTERAEIIGGKGLKSGDTAWEDGSLTMAVRRPGSIILLDEITYAQQGNIAILNTVLDRASVGFRIAETGEYVVKAKGVMFFAADNTNGCGDATGRYIGTNEINQATLDRFSRFLTFTFMPADVEVALLISKTSVPKAEAEKVVSLLNVCRAKVSNGEIVDPPSLRQAIAFVEALLDNIPADEAFESTVISKTVVECREQLRQVFASQWIA